jgi:hypothetical protein
LNEGLSQTFIAAYVCTCEYGLQLVESGVGGRRGTAACAISHPKPLTFRNLCIAVHIAVHKVKLQSRKAVLCAVLLVRRRGARARHSALPEMVVWDIMSMPTQPFFATPADCLRPDCSPRHYTNAAKVYWALFKMKRKKPVCRLRQFPHLNKLNFSGQS